MELRDYQQAAIQSCYDYCRANKDGNPCIVIPTAGGKTPILASICRDVVKWGKRVLVLAHVKELLEQSVEKLHAIDPDVPVGLYSAGLGRRETDKPVIVGGIQSVYNKADQLGKFHMIIIDEAHLIPPDGEGRYLTLIKALKEKNSKARIVGLTATPYRLGSGLIYGPDRILTDICYEVGVKDLIRRGYISKITTKVPASQIDCSGFHIKRGEFVQDEVSALFDDERQVQSFVQDFVAKADGRKSVLIFCNSIEQAKMVKRRLKKMTGDECGFVCGETPANERADILARFKGLSLGLFGESQPLRWLANVGVLTTGFDAPNIDGIVLLRPTASPGLYYQMVGRGFRLSPDTGKTNCLVLDYGGNIERHGPVDMIQTQKGGRPLKKKAPVKTCPECQTVTYLGNSRCPECGHEFPPVERDSSGNMIDPSERGRGVISGETYEVEYDVQGVEYFVHTKKDAKEGDKKTLRVEYILNQFTDKRIKEWVCPEHEGSIHLKFAEWWRARTYESLELAKTTENAFVITQLKCLAWPRKIKCRFVAGKPFPEIIEYNDFTPIPEPVEFTREVDTGYETEIQIVKCAECIYYQCGSCSRGVRETVTEQTNACRRFTDVVAPELQTVPF